MRPFKHFFNLVLRPFNYETVQLGHRQKSNPFGVQASLVTKKNPVIFDGGANRGNTCARYRKLYSGATLHLFEPFPESFRVLKQRFESVPSVNLNEAALSDAEGVVSLNSNAFDVTNSLLKSDPLADQSWGEGVLNTRSTLQVSTTTIDAYCQARSIRAIDILKLDIQGSELLALRGAGSMLENRRVGLIYMELILGPTYIGQPRFEDYLHFFGEKGYVLLDMFNPIRSNFRLIQSDVIFVPSPARAAPDDLLAEPSGTQTSR
jgi:FkbM family methyltransferase